MNLCCCCLTREPQMNLKTPYVRLGVTEIFSEMFEKCYKFRLLMVNEEQCGVCSVCVGRLQDASDFKLQVERCQSELRARLQGHAKTKGKEQVSLDPAVKSETPDVDDESIDKGDIWMPILKSESEPPASTTLVSTMEKLISCSVTRAWAEQTSKCESFESQFTMFCLNSDNQTKQKPKRNETKQKTPTRDLRNQGPYSCEKCPAVLSTKDLLIKHKRTHKTKNHTCHICDKKFMKKYMLADHIRAHNGQKPYMCEICSKNFTSAGNLWTHKQVHSGLEYICDYCGKKFVRRSDIVGHMHVHRNTLFKCQCGLEFAFKSSFKAHQEIHSDIKHFTCEVCGKLFRRKDHLSTHELIHSGEKPYCCGVCDQKFTTKTNAKRHRVKVHGQKNLRAVV